MGRIRIMGALVLIVALGGVVVVMRHTDVSPVIQTITTGATPVSIAVDARTGRAFVVNNGADTVSVLAPHDGTAAHRVPVGTGPTAVVVDGRDQRVVVTDASQRAGEQAGRIVAWGAIGTESGGVSILDAADGRLLRTIPADVSVQGAVVDARQGRVFVLTYTPPDSGGVSLLKMARGRIAPVAAVPGSPLAGAIDARANRLIVVSEESLGASVSVFDATTGRLVRRSAISLVLSSGDPLAVDQATGRAFVVTTQVDARRTLRGRVAMFNTRTGALLHTATLPSAPEAVAVDGRTGHVFVAMSGAASLSVPLSIDPGQVAMLDARTGAVIHTSRVGVAPAALAVDARYHHVLVANVGVVDPRGIAQGPGTVSVLDTRSGAVVRTVTVGIAPNDIALDERDSRAVVLNFGGAVYVADAERWIPLWLRQHLPFFTQPAPGTRPMPGSVTVLDTSLL